MIMFVFLKGSRGSKAKDRLGRKTRLGVPVGSRARKPSGVESGTGCGSEAGGAMRDRGDVSEAALPQASPRFPPIMSPLGSPSLIPPPPVLLSSPRYFPN